jgi:hypothetical protein
MKYLLTPWSRVLLEKLTSLQLVKKFPAFYGTRRFLTALTSACHLSLSWASPVRSSHSRSEERRVGKECSAARPGRTLPPGTTRYLLCRRLAIFLDMNNITCNRNTLLRYGHHYTTRKFSDMENTA